MADLTDHLLDELVDRAGWDHARCACGWETPPSADPETAANFWGQHLLAMTGNKR